MIRIRLTRATRQGAGMRKVMSNRQSLTDGVPVRVCGIPEMSPYTVDPVKGTVYGYRGMKCQFIVLCSCNKF